MSAGWLASVRAKGASGGRGEVLATKGKRPTQVTVVGYSFRSDFQIRRSYRYSYHIQFPRSG